MIIILHLLIYLKILLYFYYKLFLKLVKNIYDFYNGFF